jgi:hypothetical protein
MNQPSADHKLTIIRVDDLRQAFIHFKIYRTCDVLLKVMSEDDKEVRLLLNEELTEGSHSVAFSFGTLSGIYNIRLVINTADAIDIDTQPIKID